MDTFDRVRARGWIDYGRKVQIMPCTRPVGDVIRRFPWPVERKRIAAVVYTKGHGKRTLDVGGLAGLDDREAMQARQL